ncbi:hypothetical protein KKF61_09035 [Patescibacteria group bacterium]|nr:hypothetical protein [Patescibacteria group bacterium]
MNRRDLLKLIPGLSLLPLVGKLVARESGHWRTVEIDCQEENCVSTELFERIIRDIPDLCPLCEKPLDYPYPTHLEPTLGVRLMCRHGCMDGSGEGTYGEMWLYLAQLRRRRETEARAEKLAQIDVMIRRVEEAMK